MMLAPPHMTRCKPWTLIKISILFVQIQRNIIVILPVWISQTRGTRLCVCIIWIIVILSILHRKALELVHITGQLLMNPVVFQQETILVFPTISVMVHLRHYWPQDQTVQRMAGTQYGNLFFECSGTLGLFSRSMNEAIFNDPGNVSHYITRAKLYLERHVNGDGSFALRDCDHAIWLNPECREAHFLRCKALRTCSMPSVISSKSTDFLTCFLDSIVFSWAV